MKTRPIRANRKARGTCPRTLRSLIALVALASCGVGLPARAASPVLGPVSPPGGQRGTEIEVAFNGARLTDIKEIVFYAPGITVTSLAAASDAQVKAKLKIDPNARLGEYPLRLRTATGLSEMRTFYVGPYPSINEKENNGEFASAQKIPSRVTVTGVIDNEDVDYFLVEAKKGERLSVEVEGIRLGQTLFDPYIAILDMKRYELAAVDDSALALQDGYASILAPADGTYVIQVR